MPERSGRQPTRSRSSEKRVAATKKPEVEKKPKLHDFTASERYGVRDGSVSETFFSGPVCAVCSDFEDKHPKEK